MFTIVITFAVLFFIVVTIRLSKAFFHKDSPETNNPDVKKSNPVKDHDSPRLSWEALTENGVTKGKNVIDNGSIDLSSSNIEEINFFIKKENGALTTKLESVRVRSQHHEKIVLLENVNQEDVYSVPIPPGAQNLSIKIEENDNNITVKVETVINQ